MKSLGNNEDTSAESPRKRQLKRKIEELSTRDIIKSKKIRKLQKVIWKKKKQIASLKQITIELKRQNLMSFEEENVVLEHFGSNKEIIQRLFKKTNNKTASKEFPHSVKSFAITLHFFSPKAYNYLRSKFYNSLPHPKTLSRWYTAISAKPGFSQETIDFLKLKVKNTKPKKIICSVVFDEMAIRQHLEYDGTNYYGHVDFGNCLDGESVELAKEVLVFLIVCINESWKVPLGYFFTSGLNSNQKASLLQQALNLACDIGLVIANVTFDGCPANIGMMTHFNCYLNASDIRSDFIFNKRKIYFLPDPVHMLKLVRNCFGEKKIIIDGNGGVINFAYIQKLADLQESEGLHLGTKLRRQHLNFFNQKMKVKLAIQLLSESVATALLFCKNNLELDEFRECSPTANFIRQINNAFDILNSHKLSNFGFKQALCRLNINKVESFFKEFKEYILSLKFVDGTEIVKSQRKTGFIGFIMDLHTVISLFHDFNTNNFLKFLPTYKLNQDHLELFFSSIRSQGGHNNNPTCRQFTSAYKKILIHAEIREHGAGNCIPLEQINILNVGTKNKNEIQIINDSVVNGTGELDNENEEQFEQFFSEHDYALTVNSISPYSVEVVKYIAGFVSFKLGTKIKCEFCVSQLYGDKESYLGSLIDLKSRGRLKYPSDDVVEICYITEKIIRTEINTGNMNLKKENISVRILKYFINRNVFSSMSMHDPNPIESHKYLLVKAVCNTYFTVRINFICKNIRSSSENIRNLYTKLILFKGQ